ncbi:uncharacterized protein LOC110842004 [Folsomia candida]|uniref:uncharacterized protein LOC110842004 n=1 Tax=Folsomia candida TaxID=158441 RepID=UPI000B8EFCC2|nr:uncharacterized protein LOC110842004 [Folsomia candida]
MKILLYLLVILLFALPSFSTKVKQGAKLHETDESQHGKTETSKYLRNIIEYYNDTTIILNRVEGLLSYEPFNVLHDEVVIHISGLETIITKLEDYLHKLKNGRSDVDIDAQEHYSFMKSIDDDISKLNGESKSISSKLGQLPIQDQITEERENLIKLLSVSHEKVKNFDLSIRALSDEHEINLRYPLHDDPPPPEKFNVSILTELMNIYKIIELQQSIVANYELGQDKLKGDRELASVELEKAKLTAKRHIKKYEADLRQFGLVLGERKKKVITLIPEADKIHATQIEKALTKALSAVEINRKMTNLLSEVKGVWEKLNSAENHDEL